jgi:hypothetical protein
VCAEAGGGVQKSYRKYQQYGTQEVHRGTRVLRPQQTGVGNYTTDGAKVVRDEVELNAVQPPVRELEWIT